MRLSALFIYPVKSLRGIALSTAEIDAFGLVGDRRFLVVDEQGRFLTQRRLPRMALIAPMLTAETLILTALNLEPCVVSLRASGPAILKSVSVWKSDGLVAEDCGDEAADWLTSFLGLRCRLVRAGSHYHRAVQDSGRMLPDDLVSFADAYPFLVISEASLSDLNDRLLACGEDPVPMNRFRPNLVISDCPAYAEDTWPRITIGKIVFRAGGPCSRCIVTTTDQITGHRGTEPLHTLASYRRDATHRSEINFGQNLIHETKSGTLRVGDIVTAPAFQP